MELEVSHRESLGHTTWPTGRLYANRVPNASPEPVGAAVVRSAGRLTGPRGYSSGVVPAFSTDGSAGFSVSACTAP